MRYNRFDFWDMWYYDKNLKLNSRYLEAGKKSNQTPSKSLPQFHLDVQLSLGLWKSILYSFTIFFSITPFFPNTLTISIPLGRFSAEIIAELVLIPVIS